MGALHEGHLSLVREARRRTQFVAVSIFVNPIQFGPKEDLSRYPRDLEGDLAKCEREGVDVVFAPSVGTMYPEGAQTRVTVSELTRYLCGPHRPGHFEGVTTVVAKLFHLTGRSVAVFGRKDFQQWRVIERMVQDLDFPVEVVGMPTVRETDGLAMSSRNAFLGPERPRALGILTGLRAALGAFAAGERRAGALRRLARDPIERSFDSVDYVEVADPETLVPCADDQQTAERALVAAAARLAGTRLIDNVVLGEPIAYTPHALAQAVGGTIRGAGGPG